MQRTLKSEAKFRGIGLHSGQQISLRVLPAPADFGIRFYRVDLPLASREILARYDMVNDTRLNTRISNAHGASVSTIEHLMAAFAGLGITNAMVELDASEVPVLDGSSLVFVQAFWDVGLEDQGVAAPVYKVVRSVRVNGDHGAYAELLPNDKFVLNVDIDFTDPAIGKQSRSLDMANGVFVRELANCRTFTRAFEVKTLQDNGLALGGSLDNAVVVDNGRILNPEGFRRPDECVRHKMLDALGDLYLAGGSILGQYNGHMSGHGLTNQLLRKAFDRGALQFMDAKSSVAAEAFLPGYELVASDFFVA